MHQQAGGRAAKRRRGLTLAGQYLVLQLLIVAAVLAGVIALSLAQSAQAFERVEGRRALSAAETLAAMPAVRSLLPEARPRLGAALPAVAESVRTVSGSAAVFLATPDRTIITSPDPALLGSKLPLGESTVLSGRAWTGPVELADGQSLMAHVPVLADDGQMVGIAAVGREYPSVWDRLGDALPNLLTYLGVSLGLGAAGSLLLARRVKRQTLGLEPDEIAGLVEHREAILHDVKEGVLALDRQARITLANDSARQLLELPYDCAGKTLDELAVPAHLRDVLTADQTDPDRLVLVGERVVVCNRMPLRSRGKLIGSVTTLRDRTELSSLEKELGATRTTTDTLRAQTHEFANQLHTISGLIQLGEYDEVIRFVDGVSLSRTRLYDDVSRRIEDPAVAALLIAKASSATERVVSLQLDEDSALGRVDETLSRDLTTVVGNLVDNAIDAVSGQPGATVHVRLRDEPHQVTVTVRDSGPGVAADSVEDIFRQGFTTKVSTNDGGRGFGLALTRLVCSRRGGGVSVRNAPGAEFTAVLGKQSQSS
ncbi:signal transduction histidine kinase regulating citrate/malate metabolism [Arthrobacter crystallopoietes BAB-32]|uniref:histidine kinase n=1 Tax=Arthrobacter crystallopoietes BAB-32 TaxID=1246476 RepID=N1UVM4_9MICC|nr:sensor histidine kinase [Arthrobacter crystallopoietes]EMY34461.1 signal transduction histidine kinase regulating citrate/malate metabolism [Arthrobacter crystallopoietes BAB-32]